MSQECWFLLQHYFSNFPKLKFLDKFSPKNSNLFVLYKIWILGSKFQKSKPGFRISTSKIPFVGIFSQNGQFWIFRSKFGKIATLSAIFWFEYCSGCCRELSRGWNELHGSGWGWVKVEKGWMEVGARFSNTPLLRYLAIKQALLPRAIF